MKRISFCLAILLILSAGAAYAQPPGNIFIRLGTVSPLVGTDSIKAGVMVSFPIIYGNRDTNSYNLSNAFIIYSDADGIPSTGVGPVRGDGTATWAHATGDGGNFKGFLPDVFGMWIDTTGFYHAGLFSDFITLYKFSCFGCNGAGADTLVFGGAGGLDGDGVPTRAARKLDSGVFFTMKILTKIADVGKFICIDSGNEYPPTNSWKWPSFNLDTAAHIPPYDAFPTWSGAKCYRIAVQLNAPPIIDNCVTNLTGSHCNAFSKDFDGHDPEPDAPIVWSLVNNGGIGGSIDPSTGVYSVTGVPVGTHTVTVGLTDPTGSGQTTTCQFDVVATNLGPTIACPGGSPFISVGDTKTQTVTATDDCDPKTFYLGTGNLTGVSINPTTGVVSYTAVLADVDSIGHCVVVGVTDGLDSSECSVCWLVSAGCAYKLTIEKRHNVGQGTFENVDIILDKIDAAEGLGGFDLLIAYDNSVLSFQGASAGAIYAQCGWEYFTYRYGANGNCSGGCPSGLLRLIGIAETNNGAAHPGCGLTHVGALPTTLASMQFLVSNNRTLECQFVPIRFFWVDCADNSLSNVSGTKLFVNCKVFDYGNENPMNDASYGLPGYVGVPTACITSGGPNKPAVERNIDMQNGGIDIVCADSIDARGDINLNGLGYEIADAVMFSNYFIYGLSAFAGHIAGSQAASDVNADGISLSVADLVYLIRVIVGDAQAYPKPTNLAATVLTDNGVSITGVELGAVFMVLKGEVTPILAADAKMGYSYDGTNTRVLIHVPFDISQSATGIMKGFSGDILENSADIVSLEMADIHGFAVKVALPTDYALFQNYPNPFNPSTKISFDMPKAGDYKITVYNVTGQKVTELVGTAAAGRKTIELNMESNASGVYFYKLETEGFTATKKAVLLK